MTRLAALQIGSRPEGKAATLEALLAWGPELAEARPDVLVLPEALLGGYPKGSSFGTRLGFRTPEGRAEFAAYFENAITLDGPEMATLAALAARIGSTIVMGVIERAGSTLYCTAVFLDPSQGLVAHHRKLMPTGTERLIWGQGDGSTLPVVPTKAGPASAAICWENYMPLLRMAYYAQGVEIWCAPTVDARPEWQASLRHIALEGRCFVVSACQYLPAPQTLGQTVPDWDAASDLIGGGSVIFGPLGTELTPPLRGGEGLVLAECAAGAIREARYDFDVAGHYARPDVFHLQVNTQKNRPVSFAPGAALEPPVA
jgi:nitrilase